MDCRKSDYLFCINMHWLTYFQTWCLNTKTKMYVVKKDFLNYIHFSRKIKAWYWLKPLIMYLVFNAVIQHLLLVKIAFSPFVSICKIVILGLVMLKMYMEFIVVILWLKYGPELLLTLQFLYKMLWVYLYSF